jgi:NTE family protein
MASTMQAYSDLFAGFNATDLEEIYRHMQPRHFEVGEPICRQGEAGDSLFIIQSGLAQVIVGSPATATPTAIARLRRGDVVGEQSLLTNQPRSASVVACMPTVALQLGRDAFAAIVARHPAILSNLAAILSQRLARTSVRQTADRRRGEALALLVDQQGATLLPAVAEATARTSVKGVAIVNLTPSAVGREVWLEEPTLPGALGTLDDLLAVHAIVMVIADVAQEDLPLLLAQMDRVIVMARQPECARLWEVLRSAAPRAAIVLLHDAPTAVPSTIAGLPVIRSLDLACPDKDIAWLARHMARTKLGLALGAGGAKGYAHIAAFQVLNQAGYTVDYVSGSSIGALVGAWLALGMTPDQVEVTMRAAFTPEITAALFKLSLSGLSSGLEAMTKLCRETTGDRAFRDLAIPLSVMSVDLTTAQPVAITEGPIWQALLAATALPGMFPPFQRGDQRLVDGLTLVPVPTDAVRDAGADIVVAVNLISRDTLLSWPDMEPVPSPTRSGVRMLDTLLETLDLAQMESSIRHAALADVAITPRFGPSTWRDFHLADLFLAAGRSAAEEQLEPIGALAGPQKTG